MKNTLKVYLAGGLSNGWADRVMEEEETIRISQHLERTIIWLDPRTWQSESPEIYTEHDLKAIRFSDVVVAHMGNDNPSGYGMSLELGYAHALQKPIIFFDEITDWRSKYFDMHRSVAKSTMPFGNIAKDPTKVVKELKALLHVINSFSK